MVDNKANSEKTYGHPPTAASKVVHNPKSIHDERTLAGPYLAQQPITSVKTLNKQKIQIKVERKVNNEKTYGHPPTAASKVVYNPKSIRDERTLAGQYLVQRPEAAERYKN